MNAENNALYKHFNLGRLELTILSDGYQTMRPAHPIFGPYTAPSQVKQLLENSFKPVDFVDLSLQILLIRCEKRVIMIDSGLGKAEATGGRLPESLRAAGFQHDEITDIILTHAHTDHIGGLTEPNGSLVFPAARVYMTKTEFEFWTADVPDFSKSAMKDHPDQLATVVNDIKIRLGLIKSQISLVDAGTVLFDCIRLIAAPGHTPGHVIISVFSDGQELVHIADVVHSEILLFPNPEWGFIFDVDFQQAITTRKELLEDLAKNKKLTLAYHLPWPGLGYVRNKANAFEWRHID